jgi:hypothetical protein
MAKKKLTMSLEQWCALYGRGAKAFLARECDVRWATIHDLVTGERVASVPTAKAIETATDGAVRWASLVDA